MFLDLLWRFFFFGGSLKRVNKNASFAKKSMFSLAGLGVLQNNTDKRSRLTPESATMLTFLHANCKKIKKQKIACSNKGT